MDSVTLFQQKEGERPQHEIFDQPKTTMSKTTFDLTKWIGDLKQSDLKVFIFNQTLVFDDVSSSLTERYNVEKVVSKDIISGSSGHHATSGL